MTKVKKKKKKKKKTTTTMFTCQTTFFQMKIKKLMTESLLIEYPRPSYPWPSYLRTITSFDQLKYLTEWHLRMDLKYFFFNFLVPESRRKNLKGWDTQSDSVVLDLKLLDHEWYRQKISKFIPLVLLWFILLIIHFSKSAKMTLYSAKNT